MVCPAISTVGLMSLNPRARTRLSEQFADILQATQDDYHSLLTSMRNPEVDLEAFMQQSDDFTEKLVRLKRIHVQLSREREALRGRTSTGEAA